MQTIDCELDQVSVEVVDEHLRERGYFLIRSTVLETIAAAARNEYLGLFEREKPHPASEAFTYEQLSELGRWKKCAIGSGNGLGHPISQLLLTTYLHPDSSHVPALQNLFSPMIRLRNRLMRVPDGFGFVPARDGFWNASRIHHYPCGGGFMTAHADTYFPVELGDRPFYQVGALLSRKGVDFQTGGGFVVSKKDGKKVDIESEGGFGTVVIFDGKTVHGVDDVDTHEVMDIHSTTGRIAAFVNVYTYQG
jgi:hypothetical protein